MKKRREPIDELIDALGWIRAQSLKGRFRMTGRCGVSPLEGVAASAGRR